MAEAILGFINIRYLNSIHGNIGSSVYSKFFEKKCFYLLFSIFFSIVQFGYADDWEMLTTGRVSLCFLFIFLLVFFWCLFLVAAAEESFNLTATIQTMQFPAEREYGRRAIASIQLPTCNGGLSGGGGQMALTSTDPASPPLVLGDKRPASASALGLTNGLIWSQERNRWMPALPALPLPALPQALHNKNENDNRRCNVTSATARFTAH